MLNKRSLSFVLLIPMTLLVSFAAGMDIKVLTEKRAKLRATFELGKLFIFGEDADYDKARECFEEVVESSSEDEARAWSYLWLAKMSLESGYKEEADEYLSKAENYEDTISFIKHLRGFLSKPPLKSWFGTPSGKRYDEDFGKRIFLEGLQNGHLPVLQFLSTCNVGVNISKYLLCAALKGCKDFDEVKQKIKAGLISFNKTSDARYVDIFKWLLESGADMLVRDDKGRSVLHCACASGFLSIVRILLETNVEVNATDSDDATALHVAAEYGHKGLVELLLKKGAAIEAKTKWGKTALHLAAEHGHKNLLEILLQKGADYNAKDYSHRKAVHYASIKGHSDVVELLLRKGADSEDTDCSQHTPLYLAAEYGQKAVVKLLLDRGANVHAQDYGGTSVLSIAAIEARSFSKNSEREGIMRLLVDKIADFRMCNGAKESLCWAVECGHKDMVEILLSKGIDCKSDLRHAPLHLAVENGHAEIMKVLLANGASWKEKDFRGRTPLIRAVELGYQECVRLLFDCGAGEGACGLLALNMAVLLSHKDIVTLLLKRGIDCNGRYRYEKKSYFKEFFFHCIDAKVIRKILTRDLQKCAPLHFATLQGHTDIVALLLERGANREAKSFGGKTALCLASMFGSSDLVEFLLEKGADVNSQDSSGMTALHWAAYFGHKDVVECLLSKGADWKTKAFDGKTALNYATEKGYKEVEEILVSK